MRAITIAITLALAAPAAAQGPPERTSRVPTPRDAAVRSFGLWTEADGLGGGGADYYVAFGRDGAAFVPALPDAPRTERVELRLVAAGHEGDLVPAAHDAMPSADGGAKVRYARAPGVVELFELSAEGVEHSVELAHRPPGSGDLVPASRCARRSHRSASGPTSTACSSVECTAAASTSAGRSPALPMAVRCR